MAEKVCPECGYKNENEPHYCDDCGALMEAPVQQGETNVESSSIKTGDVIENRYEVLQIVSDNTSVSTYTAIDRDEDDKIVWIKRKQDVLCSEGDFKNQKELLEVIMNNPHENLVQVLDVFCINGYLYSVYENLDGKSIRETMSEKGGELQEDQVLEIAIQSSRALSHLHKMNILHRDICPSHLYITDKGVLKIIGFGRICSINDPPADNEVTEGFSPPEAFGLLGGKLNAGSDIFSLGASLYYIATNTEPKQFSRENAFNFSHINALDKRIGKKLESIIMKCVRKEPSNRYTDAKQLEEQLVKLKESGEEDPEKSTELKLEIFSLSHIGKVRSVNQDSCAVVSGTFFEKSVQTAYTLLVVADGMGGVAEGDKASSLAIRTISREVLEGYMPVNIGGDTVRLFAEGDLQDKSSYILKRAIEKANQKVYDYSRQDSARRGMGSTLTAGLIMKDNLCICHAGDTRGYLYNPQEGLVQLTEDHSLVGRLVRMGQLTWEEARTSPQRSAVYRALGTSSELEVDVYQRTMKPGDLYVFCSDGIWENFPSEEIESIIINEKTPRAVGEKLLQVTLDRGADDNSTLIAFYVPEKNTSPEKKKT